jgi:hypothetical protein
MLAQVEAAFHAREKSAAAAQRSEERMRQFVADAEPRAADAADRDPRLRRVLPAALAAMGNGARHAAPRRRARGRRRRRLTEPD